jgi:enoyl-CoA hydratase/carnithine racemase
MSEDDRSDVLVTRNGLVTHLMLNRVDRRNALSIGLLGGIKEFFNNEIENPEMARVVVIKANGPAFSAGSDFGELNKDILSGATDHMSETSHLESTFQAIESYPYPVIIKLHGGVYGAGCMLACTGDIRVGVKGFRFSKIPGKLGLIYPPVGIGRLINIVGKSFAKEMLLTGNVFDDETALRQGFVTHLLEEKDADEYIQQLGQSILELSPASLKATKEMFRIMQQEPVDHEKLKLLHEDISTGPDAIEGVKAILEKRTPEWGKN